MEESLINTEVTQSNSEQVEQPSWHWDDDMPGEGNRPTWLKDKYTKVTDQAKAYIEAEKRLGTSKAPSEYDLSGYHEYFDLEHEHFASLKDNARKHNITQEALNAIIDPIIQYQESSLPNMSEELAKLGDNPQARLDALDTWASNTLSKTSLETLGKIATRAEVVELMDDIRQKFIAVNSDSHVPSMQNLAEMPVLTAQDVRSEMQQNIKRYKEDPSYRREISAKFAKVLGDD